ncbi:PGF-CTERM sorting domain-containing protein [Methanosarcina barkeri]|nr:PGF-CTERM sorting domain-containing protein [Methanosarcina barkeri]
MPGFEVYYGAVSLLAVVLYKKEVKKSNVYM